MSNGMSCPYQLDKSIAYLRIVGSLFTDDDRCFRILIEQSANNIEPAQMLHCAVSDLVMHCLQMSHKMGSRLTCVYNQDIRPNKK